MKKTLITVLQLSLGGLLGYFGARFLFPAKEADAEPFLPDGYGIWILLLLPVAYLLVVGIHELGHVAAGKWKNFEFFGLTIGPFSWKPDGEGEVKFAWNLNLNLAGGLAMMLPDSNENLANRFMWFAAGGPLASVVLALGAWGLAELVGPPNFLYFFLLMIAIMSAAIAVLTILPFRAGGFASDGMRILTFLRGGVVAKADLASLQSVVTLRAGRPLTDLPIDSLTEIADEPKVPAVQQLSATYYCYLHALGAGNLDKAGTHLKLMIEGLDAFPEGMRSGFYFEETFFAAHYRKDAAAATAALERTAKEPLTDPTSEPLARAALAYLQNDSATLTEQLPLLEKALPATYNQSRVPQIKKWMAKWQEEAVTA